MKCYLWAVLTAVIVLSHWNGFFCHAQDNGDNGTEINAPADNAPIVSQPASTAPKAEEVKPAVEAAPAEAAPTQPKAEEAKTAEAAPALAPKAEKVQPEAEAVPVQAVPSVPKKEEAKPTEAKAEKFELDRVPQSRGAPAEAQNAAGAEKPEKESFWSRLFGKGKAEPPAPSAEKPAAKDADRATAEGKPGQPEPATGEAAAAAPAAQVEKKAMTQEEMLAAQEEVRRQAKEIEGLKNLDLAYQAMSRNEFDEALKLFNQALNTMPIRPHTVETRNKARMAQAHCEYRIALRYYQQGNLKEAKEAAKRALGYYPSHKESIRLKGRIEKEEARIVSPKPTPLRFSPEHLAKEKRIKTAIDRGRQHMAVHEYDKAIYEFKSVLVEEEGNEEANANLKKIAEKGFDLETGQMDRMKAEMMAQVRDTWTPPIKPEVAKPTGLIEPAAIAPEKQRLLKKLNSIVIPQLDFRQANIVDVIKYLDQQSIIADKESPPGEKGVNIILHLKRRGAAGAAAPAAPAAAGAEEELFGAEGQAGAAPSSIPTVTLTLRNIILLDTIKFITEVTGLKYRIEANVVVITPADVVQGEVITRTYRVQPNIVEIVGGAGGAAAGAGGGFTGVELMATPTAAPERGDVKKFFVEAGVPFPEGTSIVYKPSLNLLIVSNTAENLEKFEQILSKLNVVPIQVEIEARFVEIGQTDLEELGMEWLLTDNWEIAQNASAGAAVPLSARERVQMNKNQFTKGLRNLDMASGALGTIPGGTMAGIISISSVLTNPELAFILHALEQREGANLLSAPKITTKTGANAEIKVVREIIYPTEFEQSTQTAGGQTTTTVNNQLTQIVVTPSGFQTRDTGVILNVTPVVGPDGYTIDLTMMPQVVELAEWINYGSTVIDPGGVQRQLNMPQPIFHSRSIATSISIWDGQTVVMGGLITEQQATTLDKVPFLADIPLLGKLFQSKTSKSVKRNLLIFVTANLVDPAGNKVNKPTAASAGQATP